MDLINSILPVIVLYNEDYLNSKTVISLNSAIKEINSSKKIKVYIYDNSKSEQIISDLSNLEFHYAHNGLNEGVSLAYNKGAEYAKKNNKEWLLLLDQDTDIPLNFFKIIAEHSQVKDCNIFAPQLVCNDLIISPCKYFFKKGFPLKRIDTGLRKIAGINFLNSGLLINLEALLKVGGFNPRIKLYFSDFEFIDRFKKQFTYCYILPISMNHELKDLGEASLNNALQTFPYYCNGARFSIKGLLSLFQYTTIVGLRTAILTYRYKTSIFVGIFFERYLIGKET